MGRSQIGFPKCFWLDEFLCLGSKENPFKSNDKNTIKLNGISKSQKKILKLMSFINVYLEVIIKEDVINM